MWVQDPKRRTDYTVVRMYGGTPEGDRIVDY